MKVTRTLLASAALAAICIPTASVQAALVFQYRLDQPDTTALFTAPANTSPARVTDSSGNGIHGLFRDGNGGLDANKTVTASPAALGGALNYVGGVTGGDIVEVPVGSLTPSGQIAVAGNGARTFAAWVNPSSFGDNRIVGYGGNGVVNGSFLGLTVETDATGAHVKYRRTGGFQIFRPSQATNPLALGDTDYDHIVFVVPIGALTVNQTLVYIDGQLANYDAVNSSANSGTTLINTSTSTAGLAVNDYLGIGRRGNNNGIGGGLENSFDGQIGDFQFYDTALSAGNVATLFANPGSVVPEPTGLALVGLLGVGPTRRRTISVQCTP